METFSAYKKTTHRLTKDVVWYPIKTETEVGYKTKCEKIINIYVKGRHYPWSRKWGWDIIWSLLPVGFYKEAFVISPICGGWKISVVVRLDIGSLVLSISSLCFESRIISYVSTQISTFIQNVCGPSIFLLVFVNNAFIYVWQDRIKVLRCVNLQINDDLVYWSDVGVFWTR